ncbi:MAG: PH domain-containing protein [Candidatus Thorarchaeota archaeon]|nr:PH domain-containing protein [Candidatus Thorarchaeota archaeon]
MAGEGKVIKPPVENVASGKVFRPSKAFRNKMWFIGVFTAVVLWIIIFGSFALTLWLVDWITGSSTSVSSFFQYWWLTLNIWYWVITAIWLIPGVIIVPYYLRSIEYSVIAQSGETMPEIFVKKGIINITRKHVPFRTITNISSRAGLFDRLFGIGSIEVETAGYSGATTSAEEKLEGITFYEELRDFILRELRKFKDPYVTGTEVVLPEEDQIVRIDDNLEDEILSVLREIRDLLRRQKE